jgi:hypothetical protein
MNIPDREPHDVLFLQPVRYAGENLPRGRVRMLYADASGRVCASIVSRAVYDLAADSAARLKRSRQAFVTVGLETIPGRFIPAAVAISPDEAGAMRQIRERALKSDGLPETLKSFIGAIIRRSGGAREAVVEGKKQRRPRAPRVITRVLDRLPYYPEHDIEVSMPVYKAAFSYPLLLLKRLTRDEQTPPGAQRLLVLDSDEDMAIVKVPTQLLRWIEIELAIRDDIDSELTAFLITRGEGGPTPVLLPVNRLQKRGLDAVTRYFEATGHKKQPSRSVQKVIELARRKTSPSSR